MNTKLILGMVVGLFVGFAAGFLIANSLNKEAIETAKTQASTGRSSPDAAPQGASKVELSDEEIKAKIAEADKNSDNFEYQKTLGLALYTYAAMKQQAGLLEDVERLLARAYKLNGDDYDVIVSLANVNFDLGQLKKDESYNTKARELYRKALAKNEKDVKVRTDLGLTYLQGSKPDADAAVSELMKALGMDPNNEKALQYLSQAYAAKGNTDDARRVLEALRKINPQSPAISELEARIAPQK